jgi:glutamate-ammonia-ligase adenylyltransferase
MSAEHRTPLLQAIKEKNYAVIKNIMHERGLDITDEWVNMLFSVQHALGKTIPAEQFITALLSAPDEQDALEFMHSSATAPGAVLDTLPNDILQLSVQLSGASPLLAGYLLKYDDLPIRVPESMEPENDYSSMLADIPFDENFPSKLRQFKNKMIASIALLDVSGKIDFQKTVRCISGLARAIVKYTLRYASSCNGVETTKGFSVIGMGKLGADELNYSSDIDIIYTATDQLHEQLGVQKITRFAEQLTSVLSAQMADGIVYRVDLDLRPDGKQGMLVPSLTRMLTYYEAWGETWERLAMIKAAHCAGDQELTDDFLKDMQPFIFRRYLDFSTIDALKDIKQRIQLSLIKGMDQAWDVKLGEGGIRELEFYTQVMQLIRGGKEKGLRVRSTVSAIERLSELGMLGKDIAEKLIHSYTVLRTLEHRIQQYQMLQNHKMPLDKKSERRVLRGILTPEERLSADAHTTASARLSQTRATVHDLFQQLFYEQEKIIETQRPDDIVRLFLPGIPEKDVRQKLQKMGFRDIDRIMDYITILREGVPGTRYSEKTKRIFTWLSPVFLKGASETVDPDASIEHLVEFTRKIGARGIFFALLKENPKTMSTLMKFFSMSDYLSHLLINYPEYLDSLVLARYVSLERNHQDMYQELYDAYHQLKDYEDKLRLIREFKIKETLRIGINDINDNLNIVEVSEQLSMLADVIIGITLKFVMEELEPVYGTIPDREENGIMVLGMGKLGSRELNYNSDLDLVFVYGSDKQTTKQVSPQEYFSKVVQRFITAISISTEIGHAYTIDTRLRPSGNLGPLVASMDSFIRYHRESSMMWEKQALLKARGITGPQKLLEKFLATMQGIMASVPKDDSLREQIHDMRIRLEKSVQNDTANFNFKKGVGGLMDIEFIVQYLELAYGSEDSAIYEKNTFLALEVIMEKGYISKKDMDKLKDGYMFLRKLENRMRIDKDFSVEKISKNEKDLEPIAMRMGFQGKTCGKDFLNALMDKTSGIRRIYSTYLY